MHEPIWFTFLRNFPAWIVLAPMVIFFTLLYKFTGDPAYKDWISWFASALFTSFGMQRVSLPSYYPSSQTGTTQSGDIVMKTDKPAEQPIEEVNPSKEEIPLNPAAGMKDEEIEELIPKETAR